MKENPDTTEVHHSTESVPEGVECKHHWLIESPNGATSWGMCKFCGKRKEFSNRASDAYWEKGSDSVLNLESAKKFGPFDYIFDKPPDD